MPSSVSPRLRAEQQALGENLSSWGYPKLNDALLRLEEAIAGVATITLTGATYTLNTANFIADEARMAVLVFTGAPTAAVTVTTPAVQKEYLVVNKTAQSVILTTGMGTTATCRPGIPTAFYCDATNWIAQDPTLDQIKTAAASLNMGGQKITNAADGSAATDLATVGQVPAVAATQVQLASDWAQKTSGTVDGTEYSAKLWATSTTALTGGNKGAKGYAQDASGSATNAGNSASAASGSATSAGNASTSAGNSASAASGSATAAGNSATAADTSALLAGKYADNPEDSPVVTSPTTRFSALHWSRKAQATVGGVKATASDTTPGPLATKIVRPDGSAYSVTSPGGDERLRVGIITDYQQFLTSGTWTKPTGATWVLAEALAGGGSGATSTSVSALGGGGGGGFNFVLYRAADLPASVVATVGAGAAAVASGTDLDGNDGGDTAFGAFLTSPGGRKGISGGGIGGAGGGGEVGATSTTQSGGGLASGGGGGGTRTGGPSGRGGGGGGGAPGTAGGTTPGGVSQLGGSGGAGNSVAGLKAVDGQVPGGGGGASSNNGGSGAGGGGRIRVWAW